MASRATDADRLKVFVSYSRRDLEAADRLVAALESAGFAILIDRRDLPYGEEWQAELSDFIRTSDTVIWLVSPHSLASHWCNWELGEVQRLNKRLVPIAIDTVDPDTLPKQLGRIHVLPAESVFALDRHMAVLVETLNTDRGWIKEHTRLADRARQWIARDRPSALLLRGSALREAFAWQADKPRAAPPPSEEILELLLASRRAQGRRQRLAVAASLLIAIAGVALAAFALWQRGIAVEQTAIAEKNEARAVEQQALAETNEARAVEQQRIAEANEDRANRERDQALTTQSRFLADLSAQSAERSDFGAALALALEALPDSARGIDRPYVPAAEAALFNAVHNLREIVGVRTAEEGSEGESLQQAALSPDGSRFVTAEWNGTARLRAADGGDEIAVLRGHTAHISEVRYSSDGNVIATTSSDNTVRLWDADGVAIGVLEHPVFVSQAAFFADGRSLATGGSGGEVWVWDVTEARERLRLKTPEDLGYIHEIAVDPTGTLLTASSGFRIHVWNVADGTLLWTADGLAVNLEFSRDGRFLVVGAIDVGGEGGNVRLLDSATGEERTVTGEAVGPAHLSPDGRTLAAITRDGKGTLIDAASGAILRFLEGEGRFIPLGGERFFASEIDTVTEALFSPDGNGVLTLMTGGTARLWDAATGESLAIYRAGGDAIDGAQFASDGRRLLTYSTQDDTVNVWRVDAAAIELAGEDRAATGSAFSPDGASLLTAGANGTIRKWDAETGVELFRLQTDLGGLCCLRFAPGAKHLIGFSGVPENPQIQIWSAQDLSLVAQPPAAGSIGAIAPDGGRITTTDRRIEGFESDGESVRSLTTGEEIVRLDDPNIGCVQFSPDGTIIATTSGYGTAKLWNAATGEMIRELESHDSIFCLAFSHAGDRLLTLGRDSEYNGPISETGIVWDLATGAKTLDLAGHRAQVLGGIFSPNDSIIATGSYDGTVRLWNAETGEALALLDHASDGSGVIYAEAVAFSPDGRRLITFAWGVPQPLRVWDVATGELVARPNVDWPGGFSAQNIAPDFAAIVGAGRNRLAIWRAFPTTQSLMDYATSIMPRELTPEQRRQFFLE